MLENIKTSGLEDLCYSPAFENAVWLGGVVCAIGAAFSAQCHLGTVPELLAGNGLLRTVGDMGVMPHISYILNQ